MDPERLSRSCKQLSVTSNRSLCRAVEEYDSVERHKVWRTLVGMFQAGLC